MLGRALPSRLCLLSSKRSSSSAVFPSSLQSARPELKFNALSGANDTLALIANKNTKLGLSRLFSSGTEASSKASSSSNAPNLEEILTVEEIDKIYLANLESSQPITPELIESVLSVLKKLSPFIEIGPNFELIVPESLSQIVRLAHRAILLYHEWCYPERDGQVFFFPNSDGSPNVPIFTRESQFQEFVQANPDLGVTMKKASILLHVYSDVKAPGKVSLTPNPKSNPTQSEDSFSFSLPNEANDAAYTHMILQIVEYCLDTLNDPSEEVLRALLQRSFYMCFYTEGGVPKAAHLRQKGSNYSIALSCSPVLAELARKEFAATSGHPLESIAIKPITLPLALKIQEKLPTVYGLDFACGLLDKITPKLTNLTTERIRKMYEKSLIPLQ